MVASVDRVYRSQYCPVCHRNYSAGGTCPRCGEFLIATEVEERREISWSGHITADAIRAALGPEPERRDPEIGRGAEALLDHIHAAELDPAIRVELMPTPRSRVFISYVRDDSTVVDRLTADLRKARLHPWVDRIDVAGGQRWKPAIRKAIEEGAAAVVCFSSHYSARQKTYMNEELTLMIDELRQRPVDKSWFIPVRLDDCTIPGRSIGGGETLHDLQRIDLFPGWDQGVRRIVAALRPPTSMLKLL